MYRRLILSFCLLLLAVLILSVSLFQKRGYISSTLAAATLKFTVSSVPSTESAKTSVDYYLVYPGMLPDQFLYKLKMVRDRIKLFFTRNPLARVNLLLLYSDKRIGAGKVLIEGNKVPLGITTLTKGEKYLESATSQAEKLEKGSKEKKDFFAKLKKASLKHQEVFEELKEKVDENGLTAINDLLKNNKLLQETIDRQSS